MHVTVEVAISGMLADKIEHGEEFVVVHVLSLGEGERVGGGLGSRLDKGSNDIV